MNLKTLKKDISRDYIKRIKSLKVRECDEEEPRHYLAYVDEGDKSYDVSVELNKKLDVLDSNCDCDEGNILCKHQITLLDYLKNLLVIPAPKKKTVKKAQNSEILDILANVPGPDLFDWLQELFKKNKEVEIDFKIKFAGQSDQELSSDELLKKSTEIVKSIVGRKKTIEAAKVKVIVDLWKKLHQAYYDAIFIAPDSAAKIKKFTDLQFGLMKLTETYYFEGKRLEGYFKLRQKELVKSISSLTNKAEVLKTFKHVYDSEGRPFIPDIFEFLPLLFESLNPEEKEILIKGFFEEYTVNMKSGYQIPDAYTLFLFGCLENDELKHKYFRYLLPIQYANDYNYELLDHLVSIGEWLNVERIAEWIISKNYYEHYNLPYYKYLKKAYKEQGKEKERLEVLTRLVPMEFDFEDYLEVFFSFEQENERKKFRASILSKAANSIKYTNTEAANFCFKLMDHEKNYKRLISYIPLFCPVYLLEPYWEKLIKSEPKLILEAIFNKLIGNNWDASKEVIAKDQEVYPRLFEIIVAGFTLQDLKYIHRANGYNARPGYISFANYVHQKLKS